MDAPPPADESHPAEYFSRSDLTALLIFIGFCIAIFIVARIVIMVFERIYGRPNTLDRGLDSRSFSALPVITYKKSDSGRILECSICITNFEDGESVRVMPVCKHIFHKDCIDKWLRDHVTCPVCRAVIESSEPGPTLAPISEATSEPSSSISDYASLSISVNESGSVSRMASVQSTPESMVASASQPVRRVHDMV